MKALYERRLTPALKRQADLQKLVTLKRELAIRRARENFYTFCRILSPNFYLPDRQHLHDLCNTLQTFYQNHLFNSEGNPYKKLMINYPPRMGKTRTMVLFCAWIFGLNPQERVIAASYGDDLASDFSRYTRDTISRQKNIPEEIIYSDIFPLTKIQFGNATVEKWALEGQYFSYKGAGIWSGVSGKGASLLIEDDLVKDITEAIDETRLEKLHQQRTGTLLSRKEEGCKEIMIQSRWAEKDPCGRVLNDNGNGKDWYVLKCEALNEQTGELLCPSLLSMESYLDLRDLVPPEIFRANYHQEPVDLADRMYKTIRTYENLPKNEQGDMLCDRVINYTDTADEGDDFLVSITANEFHGDAYLIDVYMTKEGMEITEPETAKRLAENGVHFAKIESNNGGRGFARALERIISENVKREQEEIKAGTLAEEDRKWNRVSISWFHQTENKKARIYSQSNYVMQHVFFPVGWESKWPVFYQAIMTYQREGTAKHDDAPDALTGIAEIICKKRPRARLIG